MFLTIVNYFKRTVPGHIFRGKRRLVRKVSLKAVARAVKEYERQEQVMLLLRHPYLTLAESEGHTKELKKHDAFIEKWRTAKTMNKMKPHITIEQRLSCLKVKESWD